MSGPVTGRDVSEAAVWQDVEFGAYVADLPLWERIAGGGGPALELGAGAGRVALHLARAGVSVVALEPEQELAEELSRRGADAGASVTTVASPAAELPAAWPLDEPPGCAIAPLHVIQMVAPEERRAALAAIGELLAPGARFAATLVDESSLGAGGGEAAEPPIPDMREVGGWVYSSEPLWVQLGPREIKVRRLRKRVSPEGEIERSVHDEVLHRLDADGFEREAAEAGLDPVERVGVSSGPDEADSLAVILEARR
jgi:SAM-dependent methyltransferase